MFHTFIQEMRALKNAESALKRMAELGEMLEHEKANIKTNIAHLDRVMAPMECHEPNMHEQDKTQICQIDMIQIEFIFHICANKAKA